MPVPVVDRRAFCDFGPGTTDAPGSRRAGAGPAGRTETVPGGQTMVWVLAELSDQWGPLVFNCDSKPVATGNLFHVVLAALEWLSADELDDLRLSFIPAVICHVRAGTTIPQPNRAAAIDPGDEDDDPAEGTPLEGEPDAVAG